MSHPQLIWSWSEGLARVQSVYMFILNLSVTVSLFSSLDFWRLVDRMHISAKCRPAGSHTGAPELSIKGLNYHPQKLQINIYPSV